MKRRYAPATTWIIILSLLISLGASFTFSRRVAAQSKPESKTGEIAVIYPQLSKYAVDLSLRALEGKLETVRNHDADVSRVIDSLSASTKPPVVISDSDLDREALANAVAMKVAFGDVPENLRNKRVFRLSLEALARGATTSEEFVHRVQSVLSEAGQAQGQIILFVDQLQEYAGARAALMATASIKEAIEASHLQIIGGTSAAAYASYIASDKSLATLFESILIDNSGDNASLATTESFDKRRSPVNEQFVGDTISSDMRDLMKSAGPKGRVTAILQVSDVNNPQVRSLLARHGVLVGDSMASLGAMKVELPVKAVEALSKWTQ
jgi:hypothetical protein